MTDEKEAQLVDEQSETAQAAAAQDSETTQVATETQEKGPIPYERFHEVNESKKAAEQKAQEAEMKARLLAEQLEQQQIARANQPQQPMSVRRQAIAQLGLQDKDYLTVEEQVKVDELVDYVNMQRMAQQQFQTQTPDYGEIVGKVNSLGRFEPSESLKAAIAANPALRGLDQLVANNPAYGPYAYTVAKQASELSKLKTTAAESTQTAAALQTQQQINNQLSPMSPAAAGGGGAANTDGRFANMSDEEFAKVEAEVAAGKFDK